MPACPSTMPMANPFVSRNATGAVDVVPAKTSTSLSLFSLTLLPVRKCRLATDRVPVRIFVEGVAPEGQGVESRVPRDGAGNEDCARRAAADLQHASRDVIQLGVGQAESERRVQPANVDHAGRCKRLERDPAGAGVDLLLDVQVIGDNRYRSAECVVHHAAGRVS